MLEWRQSMNWLKWSSVNAPYISFTLSFGVFITECCYKSLVERVSEWTPVSSLFKIDGSSRGPGRTVPHPLFSLLLWVLQSSLRSFFRTLNCTVYLINSNSCLNVLPLKIRLRFIWRENPSSEFVKAIVSSAYGIILLCGCLLLKFCLLFLALVDIKQTRREKS